MKKYLVLLLVCCSLLILDNSLVPFIGIRGYYPSLLYIFVICFSLIHGLNDAVILGAVSGLLQDIYFYDVIGINAFINLIACVLAAKGGENFIKKKILIPILAVFTLSLFKGGMIDIFMHFFHVEINLKLIIYRAVYNMVLTLIVYKSIFKFSNVELMANSRRF